MWCLYSKEPVKEGKAESVYGYSGSYWRAEMYRGFNLNYNRADRADLDDYEEGKALYQEHKRIVRNRLQSFTNPDGSLNATKMTANWFPQIEADIFISHSHKDERQAIWLSGWLYQTFGLTTFIDSCIWGYADKLLRMIDDEYCLNESGKTYDYEMRNYSTSHVHMMLTTALSNMIDNTECIFFLNTPNSITPEDVISTNPQTLSPWIYSEIAMTRLIRKKKPERVLTENRLLKFADKKLNISYDIDLTHLTKIDKYSLGEWVDHNDGGKKPLDLFYELNPE